MQQLKQCVLSFDIEEWFQVENLRAVIPRDTWQNYESTVVKNTGRILKILSEYNICGTFFILGSVAEKNPDLIEAILKGQNEIASHGYGHDLTYQMSEAELMDDIRKAQNILEKLSGEKIWGYRAPNFSVSDKLIDILNNLGFSYDSSYNPFRLNSRYGQISIESKPGVNAIQIRENFYEIPVPTIKLFHQDFPIAGGAYFRILPYKLFEYLVSRKIALTNFYSFYLHPWEFEPEQPRINNIRLNYKLRHYTGLKQTEIKFRKFIESLLHRNCSFITYKRFVQSIQQT